MCMAWYSIPDERSVDAFKALVAKHSATFEGWGTDKRTLSIEGFAIFDSRKKMESFTKWAARARFEYVGSVA